MAYFNEVGKTNLSNNPAQSWRFTQNNFEGILTESDRANWPTVAATFDIINSRLGKLAGNADPKADTKPAANQIIDHEIKFLWGNDGASGHFSLQMAKLEREAQALVDSFEPAINEQRLANSYRRLEATLSTFRSFGDFQRWWGNLSDSTMRLAVADVGFPIIARQFSHEPGLGSLSKEFERISEGARTPPGLSDVQAKSNRLATIQVQLHARLTRSTWSETQQSGFLKKSLLDNIRDTVRPFVAAIKLDVTDSSGMVPIGQISEGGESGE